LALERRGEAAGLPTYYESRKSFPSLDRSFCSCSRQGITNIGLPLYTMTYEAPATVAPTLPLYPPSSGPGGVNQLPAPSPTQENHFHFHFPSLPAALHLRPRRQDDPQPLLATHTYPPNSSTEPPKYEHSYLDTSPDETAYHHQEANDEAVREAEYHEPFIHPEELRRTRREQGRSEDEVEEIGGPGQAVEQEVVASQVPLPKEEEESSSVPATQSQPPPPVELPKSLSNHSPV
jgi:hypothetical protein